MIVTIEIPDARLRDTVAALRWGVEMIEAELDHENRWSREALLATRRGKREMDNISIKLEAALKEANI
jgi:hypothetical protein